MRPYRDKSTIVVSIQVNLTFLCLIQEIIL